MFKQLYSPNEDKYMGAFAVAAPQKNGRLITADGLVAGNYYLTGNQLEGDLVHVADTKEFCIYRGKSVDYAGIGAELRLYPTGSIYQSEQWTISVMMPKQSFDQAVAGATHYLFLIVLLLLIVSLCASIYISKRYLKPVNQAINTIKTNNYQADKTEYLEINDLMDFLAKQDEEQKKRQILITETDSDIAPMFDEFLKNVKTLSPAEKSVFDLYIRGYNAQEIAAMLYLSINTIKTHNRRIFTKLNISSRKELLVYIDMMKQMNLINEV